MSRYRNSIIFQVKSKHIFEDDMKNVSKAIRIAVSSFKREKEKLEKEVGKEKIEKEKIEKEKKTLERMRSREDTEAGAVEVR